MAKRTIVEINNEFLPAIKRRKGDFLKLLKEATKDSEKRKQLMLRFGTNLLASCNDYEKVVLNVDGETVFRR
jgi:hypothetical protein